MHPTLEGDSLKRERRALITGGAGFVGSNLAARLLAHTAAHVTIFDSLARPGVETNIAWLESLAAPGQLCVVRGDVRDRALLAEAAKGATEIYHFAAQVAVTTSIADPLADCHTNILGTLHVLEAARAARTRPLVLFTSTNKVYGSLESLGVHREDDAYTFSDPLFAGVDEAQPLDFHSPYGCSKGAADQYVHDYARIYGIPTVVFRMSCIAGPRQLGTEDQGWVAHFLYSALEGEPVYNVGGGLARAISVRQALAAIEKQTCVPIEARWSEARPGDQQIYVSDTGKLNAHTGWKPTRSLEATIADIAAFWHSDLQARRAATLTGSRAGLDRQLAVTSGGAVL